MRSYASNELLANLGVIQNTPRNHVNIHQTEETESYSYNTIKKWIGEDKAKKWSAFFSEDGADKFLVFLGRLSKTSVYLDSASRTIVEKELIYLSTNPSLRALDFQIAGSAINSCDDRVLWAWNEMGKARLTHDAEMGLYDERLPALIETARGLFRLEKLESISRVKAKSLERVCGKTVDPIEVFLGLQVKLKGELNLPTRVSHMCFYRLSKLTKNDLAEVAAQIRRAETEDFIDHFTAFWDPMKKIIKRLHPALHDTTRERELELIQEVMDREASGSSHRMPNKNETDEIAIKVWRPAVESFLEEKGLRHLIVVQPRSFFQGQDFFPCLLGRWSSGMTFEGCRTRMLAAWKSTHQRIPMPVHSLRQRRQRGRVALCRAAQVARGGFVVELRHRHPARVRRQRGQSRVAMDPRQARRGADLPHYSFRPVPRRAPGASTASGFTEMRGSSSVPRSA